ncbi:hypothetical protein MNBD_CHLOROFLEXI01-5067 [hydrothermal vent metagenome]|uniref:Metallo-beta-lactamase domain-containing protein n=1 Tax=hydrothermal vent metagenome TaxID=652676 RepID=A0A3B0UX25_9ZZZZ
MPTNQYSPPAPDELEISLFGTGFGEAIALHVGQGKWVLVDSYRKRGEIPNNLEYLNKLEVDVEKAVHLVVATHWHKDHIEGIGDIFNACKSSDLVISSALREPQFLSLINLDIPPGVKSSSKLKEFTQMLRTSQHRKQKGTNNKLHLAAVDKVVYSDKVEFASGNFDIKISALSPSDDAIIHALRLFAQSFPQEGSIPDPLPDIRPNYCSVVLWVEVGKHKLLLGADLEETNKPSTGWSAIIDGSNTLGNGASVFKIPHHGSENAHNDQIWESVLCKNPYAILTPFNRGRKPLPSKEDVNRIVNLTPHAYSTTKRRRRQKIKNPTVRRTITETTRKVYAKSSGSGQIRLRCKFHDPNTNWSVELFGDACELSDLV